MYGYVYRGADCSLQPAARRHASRRLATWCGAPHPRVYPRSPAARGKRKELETEALFIYGCYTPENWGGTQRTEGPLTLQARDARLPVELRRLQPRSLEETPEGRQPS